VATEEERQPMPHSLRNCTISEKRNIEFDYYEKVKQAISKEQDLYVVDVHWVKSWINFITGYGYLYYKI
jgi:hypothetical protein